VADSRGIVQKFWAGTTEPSIVYSLFFDPLAVTSWATYFTAWNPRIAYGAVFTHQRPYVRFNLPPLAPVSSSVLGATSCELGDLLVVLIDKPSQRRVAALFQAKMVSASWPPANSAQWDLYTRWPTFSYNPNSGSNQPGRQFRHLPFAGRPDPSSQYIELVPNASSGGGTVDAIQAAKIKMLVRWGDLIEKLLNGQAGRTFSWQASGAKDDWDRLIWDLLTHTWNQVNPVAPVNPGGNPIPSGGNSPHGQKPDRGVGGFLNHRGLVVGQTTPPDFQNGSQPLEDDGWGIPIIHLIQEE